MTDMEQYPFVSLRSGGLRLDVSIPDGASGFYRGTRFDRAGVFGNIEYEGIVFSGSWQDVHDPYRHDSLTGPVEEFSQNGYESAAPGGVFLKPGVGLLRREDDSPYDWFHLYPVVDEGKRSVEASEKSVVFRQVLDAAGYCYDYRKSIVLCDEPGTFCIDHSLGNSGSGTLTGFVYNHNFFTLGGRGTGPWSEFDFPFTPVGIWREDYDSVAVKGCGFRFSRSLKPGETVYMSGIRSASGVNDYSFRLSSRLHDGASERAVSVEVSSDAEFHHAVFWGIDRIACIEPYTPYEIRPGGCFRWTVRYRLNVE